MTKIKLKARLVDKRHTAHIIEIEVEVGPRGVMLPARTTLRGVVYEIRRVCPDGLVVYGQVVEPS